MRGGEPGARRTRKRREWRCPRVRSGTGLTRSGWLGAVARGGGAWRTKSAMAVWGCVGAAKDFAQLSGVDGVGGVMSIIVR